MTTSIDFARGLAYGAHRGQTDKADRPYAIHLTAVAEAVPYVYRTVAWLHDLLEDTDWESDDLRAAGFDVATILDLEALRRPAVSVRSYLDWIGYLAEQGSPRVLVVKMADVSEHLADDVRAVLTESHLERYRKASGILGRARVARRLEVAGDVLLAGAILNDPGMARDLDVAPGTRPIMADAAVTSIDFRERLFKTAVAGVAWPDVEALTSARAALYPQA